MLFAGYRIRSDALAHQHLGRALGKMVLPLGPRDGTQHLVKLTRTAQGVSRQNLIAVRFVPLLPGQAREL